MFYINALGLGRKHGLRPMLQPYFPYRRPDNA